MSATTTTTITIYEPVGGDGWVMYGDDVVVFIELVDGITANTY